MNKENKEIKGKIKKEILESIITGKLYYSSIPNPTLEEIDLDSTLEEIEKEYDKIIWNDNFFIDSKKKSIKKETMKRVKKILKGSE